MRLYLTLTRTKLLLVCAVVLLLLGVCGKFSAVGNDYNVCSTNAERVDFVRSLGYEIDETALTTKSVVIPDKFSDVYNNYNDLQQKAGYDLSQYKGCTVMLYSYAVKDEYIDERVVNLLIYRNRVIGGDISSTALDGQMLPLKADK